MVIQGEKVSLRTTEESDLPFLRALWNHGPTMASVGFPEGLRLTRRDVAWWWRHRETRQGRAKYDLCDDVAHMVIELDDGTRVGETGFGRRPVGDIAMLELKVHADHWGLGYGTDALRTLMRHVFDHTDYNVLVVEPAAENDRARALYRRLGFEPRPRMEVLGCENRGLFMALTRRAFRELQDKEPAAVAV
jgi:RimJ/RimL family protein N-acetyltransferase